MRIINWRRRGEVVSEWPRLEDAWAGGALRIGSACCERLEPRTLLCAGNANLTISPGLAMAGHDVSLHEMERDGLVEMPGDGMGDGYPPLMLESSISAIDTLIVPAYSSRPGAVRKLYLDFNGHSAIDNWNGWLFGGKDVPETPAYTINADGNSYSALELANIFEIWKGVTEKFSPFDVDVTTVRPPSINGVRVVIGGDGRWYNDFSGGVGATGGWGTETFSDYNSANVAFVWDGQYPSNTAYIADAITHEAGHTLGLRHHSKTPIDLVEYAPNLIMGSGGRWGNTVTAETIATHRDGNTVKTINGGVQDDLAVILNGNGFGYRPDDVGGVPGGAAVVPLSLIGGTFEGAAGGVIEISSDIDLYRINHTGASLDVEVLAAANRAMLDPQLSLRNSANVVIAASTTNTGADGRGERISFNNLDPGTYYIGVGGTGVYGDIGQYRLNVRAGTATTASNDTLSTATELGVFGRTDIGSRQIGFAGTAVIDDSLTTTDRFDFFILRTPANTQQLFVRLSGLTTSASVAIYDDLDADGIVETGEILYATNPSTATQILTHNAAVGGKVYYVRVARDAAALSGDYQLRITTDAAPAALTAATSAATFDPQPLFGQRVVYDSIDNAVPDNTDYFRVTAAHDGLFAFRQTNDDGNLRLDVGIDTNGNGVLDTAEFLASSTQPGTSGESILNLAVLQGQQLLVRVKDQVAGDSSNYVLEAIADYATANNTTGVLTGARDLTGQSAGAIYDYLNPAFDFYDTYRINPAPGMMQAQLTSYTISTRHQLEIIRDANFNGVVDAGEIVAAGFAEQLTHNVTPGANYYLRAKATSIGEFFSVANYRLAYATEGSVNGGTFGSPVPITVSPTLATVNGYLAFDPQDSTQSDLEDYYQFTVAARTRVDVSISGANADYIGMQVGKLAGRSNFERIAGVGTFEGTPHALSVNLDPGTYYIRTYLATGEGQTEASGGDFNLSFKTAAVTDNSPPLVNAAKFQYEFAATGLYFRMSQDVAGSIDVKDVVVQSLDTGTAYLIGETYYDPATRRVGYALADRVLPDGNYRATLLAGSLRDASGNPLAASYTYDFFVLAGDANRDRTVDVTDLGVLAANFRAVGKTFSQGDFNYDGAVDVADLGILAANFRTTLTPPASLAAISTPIFSGKRITGMLDSSDTEHDRLATPPGDHVVRLLT